MKTLTRALQRLAIWGRDEGQDLVEYALLGGDSSLWPAVYSLRA